MSTLMKKLTLTFGCALLFVSAYATAAENDCDPCCEPSCCDSCCGYWSVYGEWLYLRPCPDGIYAAISGDLTVEESPSGTFVSRSVKNFDYDLHSGFRLGLGYSRPDCFCWELDLNWTYFSPSENKTVKKREASELVAPLFCQEFFNFTDFTSPNFPQLINFNNEVKSSWELDLHLVDFTISFPFCTHQCFTLVPHFGLRYAGIDQELMSKSIFKDVPIGITEDLFTIILKQKYENKFNGVGPRVGFGAIWDLGCGFGFYGDLGLTVAYGKTDGEYFTESKLFDESNELTDQFGNKGHNDSCCSRSMRDIGLGAYWSLLWCDCVNTHFRLGWEHHVFFNQGVLDGVAGCLLLSKEEDSDLSAQGLVLGFGVEF